MRFIFLAFLFLMACNGGGGPNIFSDPGPIQIDSTNDRLFVFQRGGDLFTYTASGFDKIGNRQPVVNLDRQEAIHALLPTVATHFAVIARGTETRLFVSGSIPDANGNTASNRILVLDYDGTTFSEADFSPITVGDDNAGTDDSENLLGGLQVDPDNEVLYVTDTSSGLLSVWSTEDGTETRAKIAVAGSPNEMSLDNGRLYIANSTTTAVDQVITVVNTTDFSTTQIDLDIPTNKISVITNNDGTALIANDSSSRNVVVRTVNTATYASSTAIGDGVVADANLTGTIGGVRLVKNTSDAVFGYVGLSEGTILRLDFTDLASFTTDAVTSTSELLQTIATYDDNSGNTTSVFISADSTGEIIETTPGSNSIRLHF